MHPRAYQRRAVKKGYESIKAGNHPIVVMPTGSGKTIVICMICNKYLTDNIDKDILVLSHRSKILSQDHAALQNYFPDFEIGLYSAGLKSRTRTKITVAGIQSVWRIPEEFIDVGLIIIDEAHLINHNDTGMYRSFLKDLGELGAQYLGLTATHFRLGHGYIHKGENSIFNDLAYDLSSTENYNKLVKDGYLSPMFPRNTAYKADTSKIGKRGGDFKNEESSKIIDRETITDVACNEILKTAKEEGLKKWLVFAIDIKHAENINTKMKELGVASAVVHSKMEIDKETILNLYEQDIYTCIVNVDLLTTGLDIPSIDLIGILRPTESPALHVQMIGRGGRPVYAQGYDLLKKRERIKAIKKGPKPYCRVLDFAGNTQRLGPINNVLIEEKEDKKNGKGRALTKVCPECETLSFLSSRYCDFCGYQFIFKEKLNLESSSTEIIASSSKNKEVPLNEDGWYDVDDVLYRIHSKTGKPSSLMVVYRVGHRVFNEYICIDHKGYAKHLADNWVRLHMKENERRPRNLSELYKMRSYLKRPSKILIESNGKWKSVKNFRF